MFRLRRWLFFAHPRIWNCSWSGRRVVDFVAVASVVECVVRRSLGSVPAVVAHAAAVVVFSGLWFDPYQPKLDVSIG